jgi:hypothetical protein
MDWNWKYTDASGAEVVSPLGDQGFPTQADAETWVGETWQELLDGGVEAVTLCEGDREVYGPMGLRPE